MVLNKKNLIFFFVFVALALALLGCTQTTDTNNPFGLANNSLFTLQKQKVSFSFSVIGDSNAVLLQKTLEVDENMNAFEAMKLALNNDLEYDTYAFGPFVKSILGVTPNSTHFWSLYVNGISAQQGIAAYSITPGMDIAWKLEEVQAFPAS